MELFFFLCLSFLVVGYILGVSDLNKNSLVWLQKGLSCALVVLISKIFRLYWYHWDSHLRTTKLKKEAFVATVVGKLRP